MRTRQAPLGDQNLIGARVTQARKNLGMKQCELLTQLQTRGIDMGAATLSKLEGQVRYATDIELDALADIFGVSADWLLGGKSEA